MANEIAREALVTEGPKLEKDGDPTLSHWPIRWLKTQNLSSEEIEEKVKSARDAALKAVSRLEVSMHTQSSSEGAISTLGKMMPAKAKNRTTKLKTTVKDTLGKAKLNPIAIALTNDSETAS